MGKYYKSMISEYALVPEDVYFTNWKNYKMEYHAHSLGGIEFNYVKSGECQYYVEDKCITLKKKNLLIINSTLRHKLVFTSKEPCLILGMSCGEYPWQAGYVCMGDLMNAYPDVRHFFNGFDEYILIENGHDFFYILEDIWNEVRGEWNAAYIQMMCNKLIVNIARFMQHKNSQVMQYIAKAKSYMTYHYFEITKIDDIADHVGIHKIYLQRIFKKYTGTTIWNYLLELRLNKAAFFLSTSDMPIGEIDSLIGMNSRQAFYANFKKYYHMSPNDYRKNYQKKCKK